MDLDFEKLILTKAELKLLFSMKNEKPVKLDRSQLRPYGLLHMVYPSRLIVDSKGNKVPSEEYCINEQGLRYIEYIRSKRFHDVLELLPNWVSMIIAIAALILSIISIVLQYA